jgi:hypothetical protein
MSIKKKKQTLILKEAGKEKYTEQNNKKNKYKNTKLNVSYLILFIQTSGKCKLTDSDESRSLMSWAGRERQD